MKQQNITKQAEIANRRREVAVGLHSKMSATQIAAQLGVSQATITRDWRALATEWKKERQEAAGSIIDVELAGLDRAHQAIWPGVCAGHLFSIDRMLKIMERRAKLLGLDADVKHQMAITINNLSDDDLKSEILAIAAQLET